MQSPTILRKLYFIFTRRTPDMPLPSINNLPVFLFFFTKGIHCLWNVFRHTKNLCAFSFLSVILRQFSWSKFSSTRNLSKPYIFFILHKISLKRMRNGNLTWCITIAMFSNYRDVNSHSAFWVSLTNHHCISWKYSFSKRICVCHIFM